MTVDLTKPIVDPEGEWLWVPTAVAPDKDAAVAYAKEYWPNKPCYEPWDAERFVIRSYDEADEDGRATLDEYGGDSIAIPTTNGTGDEYWPVLCIPDSPAPREEGQSHGA